MNQVASFYVVYDDARKKYDVHATYIDYDAKEVKRKEFQFCCDKHIFEQLAKDVLSKHQLEMLDKCPACGDKDVFSKYQYCDKDAVIAVSECELPKEYSDGYLLKVCQKCSFSWRAEPLWKKNCEDI